MSINPVLVPLNLFGQNVHNGDVKNRPGGQGIEDGFKVDLSRPLQVSAYPCST